MWNPVNNTRQKPEKVFVCSVWVMPFHAMHHGSQDVSLLRHKNGKSIKGPVCATLLCSGFVVLRYGTSLASSPSLSALSTPPLFHLIALSDWFRFNACMEQTGQLWVKQIAFKWANPIQTQSSLDLLLGSVFRNQIEYTSVPWLASREMVLVYFSGGL